MQVTWLVIKSKTERREETEIRRRPSIPDGESVSTRRHHVSKSEEWRDSVSTRRTNPIYLLIVKIPSSLAEYDIPKN